MSLDVGSRLGAYEILALIGEGGMGRVFRARDTRLKRDVAIKTLQPEIAAQPDRIARFRREAETLASLNHPHIASIHDVLESDGTQFLVLELVDGETLADRMRRGPMPIREGLEIAKQITTALEAAHARGIVHRDLKPANVKITPSGVVKVLDFGLAKDHTRATADEANLTQSPTVIGSATAGGVILGTAPYMSPEQARGQRVDAQSDIWALGCVLYEMLTARRAFTGQTVTDVLASIVRGEIDWSLLPRDTPGAIRALLRRCLQTDRARRLHHVADARIEIDDELAQPSSADAHPAERDRRRAWWAWAAMGAFALIAAGLAVALTFALGPDPPPAEMRVEITTPSSPDPLSIALSPDGRTLAFVAATDGTSRLWLRPLSGTAAQPLAGTEPATFPFWSPDSKSLAFFADGKLKRIDLAGGGVRTLAGAPMGAGGSWNRDGDIIYTPSVIGPVSRISALGGEPAPVTALQPSQLGHRMPYFLPDGRHFVFYARGTPTNRGIFVGSLDGAEPNRIVDSDSSAVLTATNHLLFVRQGTLFAQAFDTDRLTTFGEAFAITERMAADGLTNATAMTAAPAGPIAYRTGGPGGERQLTWFDRAGKKLGVVGPLDTTYSFFNPELSPDGRWVALNRTVEEYQDIWLIETARGVFRRFTFDPASDQIPVWSPDGQRIVFGSNRTGEYRLYEKAADGTGGEALVLEMPQNKFPMSFSPDGRFLLYRNTAPNTNWDLWALPLDRESSSGKPFPVVESSFQELSGEISPAGRWAAYQSNESGQYEVYIQPFPKSGARVQVSTNGGSQPRWRRDGKEIFYIGLDSRLMAAPFVIDSKGQIQAGSPVALFPVRTPGGPVPIPQKQQYAVSADGRFLVNSLTAEATTSPITLVLNFAPPR